MMTGSFPLDSFMAHVTPFYYYDTALLQTTLDEIHTQFNIFPHAEVHYALKACATDTIVKQIARAGMGADCVSGGEIETALNAGIPASKIVFAGVAKSDWEIRYALQNDIFCFNVESQAEAEVIDQLASEMQKKARVCLRINPNVDAHTHAKITTGMKENKFGIQVCDLQEAIRDIIRRPTMEFLGLHFHIGSQIMDMHVFAQLAERINELVAIAETIAPVRHINVGGGLGIQYEHPNHFPIPDFHAYCTTYREILHLRDDQTIHFELGRSIVAQCGSLITRVLYVKKGVEKQFAFLDAGMTDLIRPALYGAFHRIENISRPNAPEDVYDIVGPICESSDVFVENYRMANVQRGDILAIRSAGAYGEVMASQYNLRRLPGHVII